MIAKYVDREGHLIDTRDVDMPQLGDRIHVRGITMSVVGVDFRPSGEIVARVADDDQIDLHVCHGSGRIGD
jgi:hypothetical protein